MSEAARPAGIEDVPILAELAAAAVAEQAGNRGGAVWSVREARTVPATETLAADVADPDRLVLAGTFEGVVVGYAVVVTEALRDGRTLGVLRDVYVEPEARAVGVGEVLLEAVLAWCGERGCAGVDAVVLPGNRETKNFFETFGFTARALVVHRAL